ncbi:hypothetical protein AB0A63_19180 [Lentzea sp. NPDC042327]|uniref:hypothetical protein n=1 Tax=Lentzea sp. NPDC042327 TaxID=3154801 RepID=UPI0033CD04B4
MHHAIALATSLNCPLIAMCSGDKTSTDAVSMLAVERKVEVLAVDVDSLPAGLLPRFKTSALLARTKFDWHSDISRKRNLGLVIAQVAGWERIVFLDDDIEVPDPADLRRAAALTDNYAAAGLSIGGYPDNSVVCRAYREAEGAQEAFVGGGALAVHTKSRSSFFPDIYNEDWFFLLGDKKLRPTAVIGAAFQTASDPFEFDERARLEEFGDVLAEGLFWLLDDKRSLTDADTAYWSRYLLKRSNFILETMEMVRRFEDDAERKAKKLSSLTAALERSKLISPERCENYLQAWRTDRSTWRRHLGTLQPNRKRHRCKDDLRAVVTDLGLGLCSRYLRR